MFSGILVLRNAKYEGSLYETQYISRQAGVQLCNLRCRYCFYDDVSNSRACKNMGLLSHEMAKELIEKAFAATEDGGSVHFLFQGGEPTLAGLDFFRFFLETERSMQRKISVFHSIQTNGICLDEEWASFFKIETLFFVGISLDGTRENHDLYRMDAAGQGHGTR